MSSDDAPNSIASTTSAIRLPASGPMMCAAQHLVGLGVGQDLHEALGGDDGLGAGIGGEGKFADLVGDARGLQFFFRLPTVATSGKV